MGTFALSMPAPDFRDYYERGTFRNITNIPSSNEGEYNRYAWIVRNTKIDNEKIDLDQFSNSIKKLKDFYSLEINWDGHGSDKPDHSSIKRAQELLESIFNASKALDESFVTPHISADETGAIVFEYWKNARKLSIYIDKESIEGLKIVGPNFDDMEDFSISTFSDNEYLEYFGWLLYHDDEIDPK